MSTYRDLHGRSRPMRTVDAKPCAGCGMMCYRAEYHPYIACMLFKMVSDSNSVRANLNAAIEFGMKIAGHGGAKKRKSRGMRQGQRDER